MHAITCMQQLKVIAVDVQTKGHLNVCLAVRVSSLLALLPDVETFNEDRLRQAFATLSTWCRKSQQKFLNPKSTDITLNKGRRGLGGNTVTQHCFIISQEKIPQDAVCRIRQGIYIIFILNMHLCMSLHAITCMYTYIIIMC